MQKGAEYSFYGTSRIEILKIVAKFWSLQSSVKPNPIQFNSISLVKYKYLQCTINL